MWGTIANLKENLNKIALDVHDADDEDDVGIPPYGSPARGESPAGSDRRNSYGHTRARSIPRSPAANGTTDSPYASEVEQYKAEIKRLQASEAEIKALSVNYAAILKEKEDQIVRLNKENGSLKQNLEATSPASANGTYKIKDQSSNRQSRMTTQMKNRYAINNGTKSLDSDSVQSKMISNSNSQVRDKELADLAEGKNSPPAVVQAQHTHEIRKLKLELEQERDKLAKNLLNFHEEQKLNKSFQEELKLLKLERDKTTSEMKKLHNELNEKVSEIKRLQLEFSRREDEAAGDAMDSSKRLIETLEKENTALKTEKNELEAALKASRMSFTQKMSPSASQVQNRDSSSISDLSDSVPSKSFPGKEDMEISLQKLSKDLKETQRERDKAVQQLTRLKQHLLEKESEDSEKMDEDTKIIEELRDRNNYLKEQISNLERTLKQSESNQEKLKIENNNEILKSREIIDDLNKKLTNCMSTIDAKNVELLNLQTALGQYYAEIEAKEYLEGELAHAREETAKLSQLLKDADGRADVFRSEKEEIFAKLSQSEKVQSEWRSRVSKLEEENARLRRALEQNMTRLNRMSVDSDFLVDRRIVIKLLVTYFQRNHSKEVLDLMVRMLGFTNEDKQRIGHAQQGPGKGVVRGVLGLPGRLVGGIMGGSSTESAADAGSDNQSFADLWVDFLLKETEREKRELEGSTRESVDDSHEKSPNVNSASPQLFNQRFSTGSASVNSPTNQNSSPFSRVSFQHPEQSGSEFSTVPLTSSDSKTSGSYRLPRY